MTSEELHTKNSRFKKLHDQTKNLKLDIKYTGLYNLLVIVSVACHCQEAGVLLCSSVWRKNTKALISSPTVSAKPVISLGNLVLCVPV